MGKFFLLFSRLRAIFRPETVTDNPVDPCTKPECLPRPPAASNSGKLRTAVSTDV